MAIGLRIKFEGGTQEQYDACTPTWASTTTRRRG